MFITDHPELAAGIFAYDPAHPWADRYAWSIALDYANHELTRLWMHASRSSSTAFGLLTDVHPRATRYVCGELQGGLLYFTQWWEPGWEATFTQGAVEEATRTGLLEPHQSELAATWITALQRNGVAIFDGADNPMLDRATPADARVLLAMNVMALRAMGDHADEVHRGGQQTSARDIWETEALLAFDPLPGLPQLPFRGEEAARWARWYRLADL